MDLKLLDTNPQLSFRRNSNILQAIIGNLTATNDDCDPSRLQSWLVNATLKKIGKKRRAASTFDAYFSLSVVPDLRG